MSAHIHKFRSGVDVPLKIAREWVLKCFGNGHRVQCPCCDQTLFKYRRVLNSGMASALSYAYKLADGDPSIWLHLNRDMPSKVQRSKDWGMLQHWGLISKRDVKREHPEFGYWRITERGVMFVQGHIKVPRRILTYGKVFYGYEDEADTIGFQEALKTHFDYSGLWGAGNG